MFLLLALVVRLWFDIAQVRAVAQNERGMWRNLWKACRITWRDLGQLFWMYFRISLFAWVTLALGLVIWAKLPPTATPVTFVLLELILLAQLGLDCGNSPAPRPGISGMPRWFPPTRWIIRRRSRKR